MELSNGDLFVVTRGIGFDASPMTFMGFVCESVSTHTDTTPRYDRSDAGLVYRALAVCGPVIAAECVFASDRYKRDAVGKRRSINTTEVEIWPVTPAYLAALLETAGVA